MITRYFLLVVCGLMVWAHPGVLAAEEGPALNLGFEKVQGESSFQGWGGGPGSTIHVDSTVVQTGDFSVRLERDAESEQGFSTITQKIPIDFSGEWIEMRGFLRTEGVTGYAGLWMRQDGPNGMISLENMKGQNLTGSAEWKKYTIRLPLDENANDLYFGFLMAGEGRAWADALEFFVDGEPLSEAPERVREETILDTDLEFAAGSGIATAPLTEIQADNLAALAKVWGFLKYHHPLVAAGDFHWDFELFRAMPDVLFAADRNEANAAMADWLEGIGVPTACSPCADDPTNTHLAPDLDWIHDAEQLGEKLSGQLQAVWKFRFAGEEQFYLSTVPRIGNPEFKNELTYFQRSLPDAGYRLLALFRTWNIIQYWFPYRDLMDEDWDLVLREFIPRMMLAETWDDYRLEFFALAAHIQDGHANLWPELLLRPPTGEYTWPVEVRFFGEQAAVAAFTDSVAGPASGFEIGDVITSIDGEPLSNLMEEWTPYYCASNRVSMLKGMGRALSRGPAGPGEVGIERNGKKMMLTVERLQLPRMNWLPHDRPGETFQMLSPEVAYIKLSGIRIQDVAGYIEQSAGTRGLVIDIRNYPSEFVVFELGGQLVQQDSPFVLFTNCDPANPGAFVWTGPISVSPTEPGYAGKVVVLVNDSSMSQAEYTAMAFRAGLQVTVVGSTTAGADGNVSNIPLPGGLKLMMSGIGVFYPDKSPTQRVGIVPDVFIEPTIAGTMAGRDEVLEEALKQILGDAADEDTIVGMARRP